MKILPNLVDLRRNLRMNEDFWRQGDRIILLTSGGAFLGVLLTGGIAGAVVGGIVAFVWAWCTRS